MDEMTLELELPGFRFHPTEEELLNFYLKNIIFGKKLRCDIISLLNIYHHEPWELPGLAKIGEREWYFFVPRDRKHGNGGRPNRTTEHGFWKATGSDRKIVSLSDPKRVLGLKKTLVFYKGRAPRGSKTDWVMNEYRLPDACTPPKDIVLCKIYRKATSLKVLEQRAAMEEEMKAAIHALQQPSSPSTSTIDTTLSFCTQQHEDSLPQLITQQQQQHRHHNVVFKKEGDEEELIRIVDDDDDEKVRMNEEDSEEEAKKGCFSNSLHLPSEIEKLPDLLLPKPTMDWTQDTFWTQLRSPWLDNNFTPYANIMNF